MKILLVETEHTAPFKILFEVLKDMLTETNIEFYSSKKNKKITYYHEREWRYCPSIDKFEILIKRNIKKEGIDLKELNESLQKNSLHFTGRHIKYIIVNKNSDIKNLQRFLNKIGKKSLIPKIISLERIETDF